MRQWFACTCLTLMGGLPVAAAPVRALPPDLDLLPIDAAGFVSVRPGDFFASPQARLLRKLRCEQGDHALCRMADCRGVAPPGNVERFSIAFGKAPWDVLWALSFRKAMQPEALVRHCAPDTLEGRLSGRRYHRKENTWKGLLFAGRRALHIGPAEWIENYAAAPAVGPLSGALAIASRHAFTYAARLDVLVPLTFYHRWILGDPSFPYHVPGARVVIVTADPGDELVLSCAVVFEDEALAKKAQPMVRDFRPRIGTWLGHFCERHHPGRDAGQEYLAAVEAFRDKLGAAVRSAEVRREGAVLSVQVRCCWPEAATGFAFIAANVHQDPPVVEVRGTDSLGQMRSLAKAILAYHDDHKCLPPAAICDAPGAPLPSWRVAILPYLGEKELYARFHLDEAWDSPHNARLIPLMPTVFDGWLPHRRRPTTNYRVFTGKGTLFDHRRGVAIREVDAPDQKILVLAAGKEVPWTKPDELPLCEDGSWPQLGASEPHWAAFADGSVGAVHLGKKNGSQVPTEEKGCWLRRAILRKGKSGLDRNALMKVSNDSVYWTGPAMSR